MYQHILKGLNPYRDAFPSHLNELVQQVATGFNIPLEKLDHSVDSLYLIDYFLLDNVSAIDETFVKQHVLKLIAYLGEVYIANRGGKWIMILFEDNETWEPQIQSENGRIHSSFVAHVYATLMEDDYPSIRSCYFFSDGTSFV